MNNNEQRSSVRLTHCPPALLAINDPVRSWKSQWIIKDLFSGMEANSMLGAIDSLFLNVPLEEHCVLRTYDSVTTEPTLHNAQQRDAAAGPGIPL